MFPRGATPIDNTQGHRAGFRGRARTGVSSPFFRDRPRSFGRWRTSGSSPPCRRSSTGPRSGDEDVSDDGHRRVADVGASRLARGRDTTSSRSPRSRTSPGVDLILRSRPGAGSIEAVYGARGRVRGGAPLARWGRRSTRPATRRSRRSSAGSSPRGARRSPWPNRSPEGSSGNGSRTFPAAAGTFWPMSSRTRTRLRSIFSG